MSYGLSTWDAGGVLILSTNSRVSQFRQTLLVPGSVKGWTNTYTIPGFALDGKWFFYCRKLESQTYLYTGYRKFEPGSGYIKLTNTLPYTGYTSPGFYIDIFYG